MSQSPQPEQSATKACTSAPPLALNEFLDRCMGNADIACLVLDKFERQLKADIRTIEERLAVQDAGDIARTAHALKGSAGAAAAAELQHLAARIEGLARQDRLDAIAQELTGLRAEVERCLGYMPMARGALKRGPNSAPATETGP